MAAWLDGWMAAWQHGWMAGWLDGWVAGWLGGWMDGVLKAGWTDHSVVGLYGDSSIEYIKRWMVQSLDG